MKVIVLLPQFTITPTGGYKVILEYANRLSEDGIQVKIGYFYGTTFNKFRYSEWLRRFIVRNYVKFIGCSKWFKLNKEIKEFIVDDINTIEKADVYLATAIGTSIELNRLDTNAKKMYFIQDFENWNFSDEEVYKSYNYGMTNIVVSNWLKLIVDAHSTIPSHLVTNGINTDIFTWNNVERINHSIVFHYRSGEYKGCKYAIEAIKRLYNIYDDLTVSVISIEAKPSNLPKQCKYYHSISPKKIAEINNKTQVFICTTVEEGFGLPGLEAMACGCAVVSTSYRGVHEYAMNGYNALLSPVKNVDAIVNNVVQLFENDALRKKICKNGIKTGKEKSLFNSAKQFEKILMDN